MREVEIKMIKLIKTTWLTKIEFTEFSEKFTFSNIYDKFFYR